MATVFMMRFNSEQGGLIADESTWHLGFLYGYRRSNYGDHIYNILTDDICARKQMTAIYTGVGFPSFHFEVAKRVKAFLNSPEGEKKFATVEDLSEIVFKEYQKVHQRMVGDRIRFFYGFTQDDWNTLSYSRGGKQIPIQQKNVIDDVRKIVTYQEHSPEMQRIFDNPGVLMGYSPAGGLEGYYFSPSQKGSEFAYALSVMGPGSQIASHIFGEIVSTMDLESRRKGFDLLDGLMILLEVAVNTRMFQCKMGGYFQLALINGRLQGERKISEMADHRTKLAVEVASALSWELLDRNIARNLIQGLILDNLSFEDGEAELFAQAKDPELLKRYLMGYKPKTHRFRFLEDLMKKEMKNNQGDKDDVHQCH